MRKLHLSPQLALPASDAVTQTFAFLARRGAGKTYGASKLSEEMLGAGAQVVVLDPVGNWWGLRVDADGKSKGFDVPVFGGEHGDVPLEPTAGVVVARFIVETGSSVILDVSQFRKNQRKQFCTDLAEELFHLKKSHRAPMHLFVEESQVFVPQKTFHGDERMLGAFEDIIKLGRNYGIGATLISQRPQAVNKDVLNQTECLVVLQTNGAQERAALKEWMKEKDVDQSMLDELPRLQRGEAFVWSPSWLQFFGKVKIAKKRTFDASATPELGQKTSEPRKLAPVDLDKIREAMKETIAKAEQDDPKALRRQVAELRKQLAAPAPVAIVDDERVAQLEAQLAEALERPRTEVVVIKEQDVKAFERACERMQKALDKHIRELQPYQDRLNEATQGILAKMAEAMQQGRAIAKPAAVRAVVAAAHAASKAVPPAAVSPVKRVHAGDGGPNKIQQLILDGIAWFEAVGLTHPKRAAIAGLIGYKQSGHFNNNLGALKSAGCVEYPQGNRVALTPRGRELAREPSATPTLQALHDGIYSSLNSLQRQILAELIRVYPNDPARAELAAAVGKTESGHFNNNLGALRTMELVEYPAGGHVRASDVLFPEGLS